MSKIYSADLIEGALTYKAYRHLMLEAVHLPSGDDAAKKLQSSTKKNISIMGGFEASARLAPGLRHALLQAPPVTWLVISEGWCGDAAFILPVLAAAEQACPENVTMRIVLRDDHPDLINEHLTDGGQSIPIIIALGEGLRRLGIWGPRPQSLQRLVNRWKTEGIELHELIPRVEHWYNTDNTDSLQQELRRFVESYS
jgi:hypothetical protein